MAVVENLPAMPFERESVLEISPLYRLLQSEQPIARVLTPAGDVAWLVMGYEDVRALLTDERLGRSHPDPLSAARFSSSAILGGPQDNHETEKTDHARMRRVLTRSFMVKRMQALRPGIQAIVDDLLSRMALMTPPVDLHEHFSFPLPVLVICELLGVPYEERDRFRTWSDDAANLWDSDRAIGGMEGLRAYMRELIERKRQRPGADVISDLIAVTAEEDRMTDDQMVRVCAGLLFAGHETTVARIDFGTLLLLTNPDQRQALQPDPSLAASAVEEILRLAAPSGGAIPRYANADIEIGGVTIRSGDLTLIGIDSANRDDRVFAEPERFDITRGQTNHVAFGHGNHFCLGAGLARVELQAVFGTLFQRLPTLELAVPVSQLRLRSHVLTGGLTELPVTW